MTKPDLVLGVTLLKFVNVHEAKTHLSRLLDEVNQGHEIIIAKAGKPIARLVPVGPLRPIRTPGFLRHRIRIADDCDAPLPEEMQCRFEGSNE